MKIGVKLGFERRMKCSKFHLALSVFQNSILEPATSSHTSWEVLNILWGSSHIKPQQVALDVYKGNHKQSESRIHPRIKAYEDLFEEFSAAKGPCWVRTLILSNPLPYLDLLIPWGSPPNVWVKPPEVKRPPISGVPHDLLRSFDFGSA